VTRRDLVAAAIVLLLAIGTVVTGRRARLGLTPRSALQVASMLNELELPIQLPDAPLLGSSGDATTLLVRIRERRAAIAFYAPWCGPCQKELPELAAAIANEAQLIVVVSKDEGVEETRQQLANIGLGNVGFYVDATGRLFDEARVTSLPTTFLVTRSGGVLARGTGYSQLTMLRMRRKARSVDTVGSNQSGEGRAP
jgi:thiol-disulfide isomerase/thioredoxin